MAKRKKEQVEQPVRQTKISQLNISDFFTGPYRDYALYVNSTRALPSLVDGFRTGARKIMHAAIEGAAKHGKSIKFLNLIGDTYNLSIYMHGDVSLENTIYDMVSDFRDNLNPLTSTEQIGSLRSGGAAAPRYLYCKLSKYTKMMYGVDEELLEYVFDEGQFVEPKFYLPIIPTLITRRTTGIGNGYAHKTFSYNPIDIINACIEALVNDGGAVENIIRPYVRTCKSSNFVNEDGSWYNYGELAYDLDKNELIVKDLPYDISYDSYEKSLNNLIEKDYIRDWNNFSEDGKIEYRIKFEKNFLRKEIEENYDRIIDKLRLRTRIPKDNLTVMDENGMITYFSTPQKLVEYFVRYRLTWYEKRKTLLVQRLKEKIAENGLYAKFIKLVIDGKILIANRQIADIKKDIASYELPEEVINIKLSKITKDEYEDLLEDIENLKKRLQYVESTPVMQMYINDLIELREELSDDFND